MIKYLLKFVSEKSHADDLVAGKLFVRPASYYHGLERGQGDDREAGISGTAMIYKNSSFPIYCMTAIQEREVEDNTIKLSEKLISDFKCEHGYLVLLDYARFSELLSTVQTNGYSLMSGLVSYRRLTLDDTKRLFVDKDNEHFFIKHPVFSYQHEFRILITKAVYEFDKEPVDFTEYWFKKDLKDISQIYEVSSLQKEKDCRLLKLSNT